MSDFKAPPADLHIIIGHSSDAEVGWRNNNHCGGHKRLLLPEVLVSQQTSEDLSSTKQHSATEEVL